MTTHPAAEAAREASRRTDGRFGTQPATEAEIDLAPGASGAGSAGITGLRFGAVYTTTDDDGATFRHADLTDPALATRIAAFQTAHGYEVSPEQVRVRTAMGAGAVGPDLRIQLSLDGGTTWEDEPTRAGTPVAATVSNLLAGYDRGEGHSVPWRRDDLIMAPARPLVFDTNAGAVERAHRFDDILAIHPEVDPEFLESNYIASLTDMARRVGPATHAMDPTQLHQAVHAHFDEIRPAVAGKPDPDSVAVRDGAAEAMAQVLERGELKSTGRRRAISHQLTLALAQDKSFEEALAAASGPVDEHRFPTHYNARFTG